MRIKMWFSGNPIPWATGIAPDGHSYVLTKTREWQETVGWQLLAQSSLRLLRGDLGIEFIFFRENRLKVDIKNLVAAMEDALKGFLFEDDSQLKVHKSHLRYNKERPGVEVEIWQL